MPTPVAAPFLLSAEYLLYEHVVFLVRPVVANADLRHQQFVTLIGLTPAKVVYTANYNTKQVPYGGLRITQPNAGLSIGAASCAAALLAAAVPAEIVHTSPHAMPSSFLKASSQLAAC